MAIHHGSCLCGSITYEVHQQLSDFGYCHCRCCRKASGTAHGANAGIAREHFLLHDDNGLLREFESSPGKRRAFCSRCGSPLFAYLLQTPEQVRIRLGTLDSTFTKTAQAHTFVSEKAAWEEIGGGIPQFPEWADRAVLVQVGSKQP